MVTIWKLLLTAIRDVRITPRQSWNCPFRGHLIITPSLGSSRTDSSSIQGAFCFLKSTNAQATLIIKIYWNLLLIRKTYWFDFEIVYCQFHWHVSTFKETTEHTCIMFLVNANIYLIYIYAIVLWLVNCFFNLLIKKKSLV